ncbi:response regulator [Catenuloplanes sp. NPDC051500]|uniref:response regulator n=1 Tax=Catenuloplanes sp. NPDC051500 TaxID=3363959 RepID=UPI0037BA1E37
MAVRVVIVDDQPVVRAGLVAFLTAQPDLDVVGEAADGYAAIEVVGAQRPDVVLMDVRMPRMDGLTAAKRLLSPTFPDGYVPKVLMLTTFDIDDHIYEALSAGASGFLLKDALPEELAAAVRVVAAGEALLAPSVTRRMIEHFVSARPMRPEPGDRLSSLTAREREILTLMAGGLSNHEIAADLVIAEQTVKSHVSRILMKQGLRDRAQAVVLGYETGLVRPGRNEMPRTSRDEAIGRRE